MEVWPTTLPNGYLLAGLSENPPDLVLRSEMGAGPAKLRRKASAGVRPISRSAAMTSAEVEILDIFYVTTLGSGVDKFTWENPRTGESETVRFTSMPIYTPEGEGDYWNVSMDLEILP